jgi:hypothetical protein
MGVNISEALGRLPRQAVGIPELSGARAAVENVVHTQPNSPVPGERELHIAIPLPIAAALDLIICREWLFTKVAKFETAAPGSEILDIQVE